jgi:hypothetical protein
MAVAILEYSTSGDSDRTWFQGLVWKGFSVLALNSNAICCDYPLKHKSALKETRRGKLLTPENRGAKHNQRTSCIGKFFLATQARATTWVYTADADSSDHKVCTMSLTKQISTQVQNSLTWQKNDRRRHTHDNSNFENLDTRRIW